MARRSLDLGMVALHAVMALALALPGLESQALRLLLGLPLALISPGYALTAAIFPRPTLGRSNRLLLTLALSICATILCGFGLNRSPWGMQRQTWTIALATVTLAACIIALGRRALAGGAAVPAGRGAGLGMRPGQALLVGLALALVAGTIVLARQEARLKPPAAVIQLWMLPDSTPATVRIGITSVGEAQGVFRLVVARGGFTLREWSSLTIAPGQSWEERMTFDPKQPGAGPFEALLYRSDQPGEVFRRVALSTDDPPAPAAQP